MAYTPDLDKPLSAFNFPYWSMLHGVAEATGTNWPVLAALSTALPNVNLGKTTIARRAGCSITKVKRARRELRRQGWISYEISGDDDTPGGDECARYTLVDVRDEALVKQIIARDRGQNDPGVGSEWTGVKMAPVQDDPGGGANMTPEGGQNDPGRGVKMAPKVLKGSTQSRTQGKDTSVAADAAHPRGPSDDAMHDPTRAGQEQQPAAATTGKATNPMPKAKTSKSKKATLTSAQGEKISTDDSARRAYWALDTAAVDATDEERATMKPTKHHWAPASGDINALPEAGISPDALALWWFCHVQEARKRAGMSTTGKPLNVGGLKNRMANLAAPGKMSQDQVVAIGQTLTGRWPEVFKKCSWMDDPPELDEKAIFNEKLRGYAESLRQPQPMNAAPAAGGTYVRATW